MLKQLQDRRGSDEGFTLIELLIAIVVIGVLSAVVIVGIGGLTNSGKAAACGASADAAKAATAVYYANNNGTYPATFAAMTGAVPKILEFAAGVTPASATELDGSGWKLTMTPGAVAAAGPPVVVATPPTYACS